MRIAGSDGVERAQVHDLLRFDGGDACVHTPAVIRNFTTLTTGESARERQTLQFGAGQSDRDGQSDSAGMTELQR